MATRSTTGGATDLDGSGMPVFVGERYSAVMADALYANTLAGGETGPTGWLPSATALNGTTDRFDSGQTIGSLPATYTLAVWAKVPPGADDTVQRDTFFGTQNLGLAAMRGWQTGAYRGAAFGRTGTGGYVAPNGPVPIAADTWVHFAAEHAAGAFTTFVDGAAVATCPVTPAFNPLETIYFGSAGSFRWFLGDMAEAVIASGQVSGALYAGPEPTVTATTLAFSAGQLTADLTHNNPSNGAVTKYALIQRNNAGTWETVSEGAGPLTYRPNTAGTYRAIGIATNNGGDSVAVVSSTVIVPNVRVESSPGVTDLDGSGMPVFVGERYSAVTGGAVGFWFAPGAGDSLANQTGDARAGSLVASAFGALADAKFGRGVQNAVGWDAAVDPPADYPVTIAQRWQPTTQGGFNQLSVGNTDNANRNNLEHNVTSTNVELGGYPNGWRRGQSGYPTVGEYHSIVLAADRVGGNRTLDGWVNATRGPQFPSTYEGGDASLFEVFRVGGRGWGSAMLIGITAELVLDFRAWQQADVDAYHAGPEPTVTATTLAFSAGQLTADLTHNNPSNGAVTKYALIQRDNAGTWETVSEGAGPLTFTPLLDGDYRAIGIATNNGGDSVAVASSTVAVTFGTPRFTIPLITPLLTPVGA